MNQNETLTEAERHARAISDALGECRKCGEPIESGVYCDSCIALELLAIRTPMEDSKYGYPVNPPTHATRPGVSIRHSFKG